MKKTANMPKKIWFLWFQGFDEAPNLVKCCYNSWVKNNNGWEVKFIDKQNIVEYLDLEQIAGKNYQYIAKAHLADIVRINLLRKYGGIWVDATCFCCLPLDSWIYEYMEFGFFVFSRPGKDRMISNWFIASTKDNYIISVYTDAVNAYVKNCCLRIIRQHSIVNLLRLYPMLTFSFIFTKILKVCPYFWFHYLFERLYRSDAEFKKIWDSSPKFSADIPHKIQIHGMLDFINLGIKGDIDQKKDPLYKLSWKYDSKLYKKGCTLDYLLSN